MSVYSKFLSLVSGTARTVDLSTNTLSTQGLQLNSAGSSGWIAQTAHASTSNTYTIAWPAALPLSSGYVLSTDTSGNLSWVAGSTGSVTSVAFADDSTTPIYSVSGSPVTTSGTLAITLETQSANAVFAGPTTGSAAQPTFRALVSTDIPSLSSLYLALTGGTMSGAINMGSNKITSLAAGSVSTDAVNYSQVILVSGANAWSANQSLGGNLITNSGTPVNPNDLASKSYVDNLVQGLNWKETVRSATTTVLPGTYAYNNGTAGVGATITQNGTITGNALNPQDGVTLAVNDRLLVKNETGGNQPYNGIYVVTQVGDGSTIPYILTRSLDADTAANLQWATVEIGPDASTQAGQIWREADDITTIGTDNVLFTQVSQGANYVFTSGVQLVGNTVSADVDNSTIDVNGSQQLEVKAGGITNTQVNASAAIAFSKLASLTSGNILVGSSGNVATSVTMSGDATIVAGGALTLATINSNVGSFGSSTSIPSFTVNAKGLITAASGNAVIAPAGTLSGTTLNSTVVSSSLTSVGTIATGVWQGTAIGAAYGGTGVNSSSATGVAHVSSGSWTFSSVVASDLGTITDGVTLDQSGAGSTLEIKSGGVGTTQLAAQAVTYAKIQAESATTLLGNPTGSSASPSEITLGATLAFSGSALETDALTGDVTTSANSFVTTVAKIQGTVVGGTTGTGNVVFSASPTLTGTISAANLSLSGTLSAPTSTVTAVYTGSTLTANTTYAMRWGIPANSETTDHLYVADWSTSSFDLFWIVGLFSATGSTTSGTTITVVSQGNYTLGSSDTTFGSTDQGKPVWLSSAGAITANSAFSPSSGDANEKIGMVTSATTIWVAPQMMGVS